MALYLPILHNYTLFTYKYLAHTVEALGNQASVLRGGVSWVGSAINWATLYSLSNQPSGILVYLEFIKSIPMNKVMLEVEEEDKNIKG